MGQHVDWLKWWSSQCSQKPGFYTWILVGRPLPPYVATLKSITGTPYRFRNHKNICLNIISWSVGPQQDILCPSDLLIPQKPLGLLSKWFIYIPMLQHQYSFTQQNSYSVSLPLALSHSTRKEPRSPFSWALWKTLGSASPYPLCHFLIPLSQWANWFISLPAWSAN